MSLPRLPFLYPQFFRASISWDSHAILSIRSTSRAPRPVALFHHHARRRQESTYTQRYGPAAEPIPPPSKEKTAEIDKRLPPPGTDAEEGETGPQTKPAIGSLAQKDKQGDENTADKKSNDNAPSEDSSTDYPPELAADEAHPAQQPPSASPLEAAQQEAPEQLEKVLHMEAPTAPKSDESRSIPQMQPPRYVHHFDTYSLVRDLQDGGFSEAQSVTMMKSIRGMLAVNLDIARDGLVSKSDVENETYLFRAACSELKTEIMNARKRAADGMRSDRAHLQHEADILGQKITQESGALKDDLKGMFDDRKMAVRMEQRNTESAIQELNYKITVDLVGDSKGEVEGLRWVLTRRAAMFIGGMALLVLGYLRYSTYVSHMEQEERKRVNTSMSEGSGSRLAAVPTGPGGTDAILTTMGDGKGEGEGNQGVGYVSLG